MRDHPLMTIRQLVALFNEQGNLVADATKISKAVEDGYATLSIFKLAKHGRDRVAIALWHRFGSESVEEWEDETHKAEYMDAADEVIQYCRIGEHSNRSLEEGSSTKPILAKRPVAFRIRRADADTAGATLSETDWRYFSNEDDAWKASDALGTEYQALFTRDGTAIVAEWETIGSAPTGGTFLVCAVGDDRGAFVVSGEILWRAMKDRTPSHLSMKHLTHWMPLPALPLR